MTGTVQNMVNTRQEKIQSFAFIIAITASVLLSIVFADSSLSASAGTCEIELDSRINPNNAPIASMMRLPGIGTSRATAIAAYREQFKSEQQAFENCNDLQKIKGIGPKTAENICGYLKFE